MLPTITSSLHLQRTTAQGPQVALGTLVQIGAGSQDQILFYVTSAGVIAGGPMRDPASTDVAVKVLANTGPQTWIYVYNDSGSTLERGMCCIPKAAVATRNVKVAATSSGHGAIVGVAQCDIATGTYGWILREGCGEVLADAAGTTDGVGIKPSNATAGSCEFNATPLTEGDFGLATETVTSGLATCHLKCRG